MSDHITNPILLACFFGVIAFLYISFAPGELNDNRHITNDVVLLAEDGGWGYAGPHGVVGNDVLYYSYLDTLGITWVASYDFETGEIERTAVWEGDADLHSSNPLVIRPDGRVQVFVDEGGYADERIRWRVSDDPFDIGSFGEVNISSVEAGITQGRQFYPVVHDDTGDMYVVVNSIDEDDNRYASMWKSFDGGNTFEEYRTLWALGVGLESNRTYTRVFIRGDNLYFVVVRVGWNEPLGDHDIGRVEGIYFIRYNVVDESFYRANDRYAFSADDLPVYDTERFDRVWDWKLDGRERERAIWSDIIADENGIPYIAFALQKAVAQGASSLHDGYLATPDEEGVWRYEKVSPLARGWDNTPERKNYAIAIDPQDPNNVFVSMRDSEEEELSQVHKMRRIGGGDSWESVKVYSDKGRTSTVVVPRVIDGSASTMDVLWLEGRIDGWREYNTGIKGSITPRNND